MKSGNDSGTRVLTVALLIVLAIPAVTRASDRGLTLSAYFKNFTTVIHPPDYSGYSFFTEDWLVSTNNRLRINTACRTNQYLTFSASYDIYTRIQHSDLYDQPFSPGLTSGGYRAADLDHQIYPEDCETPTHLALYQNLDRLNVSLAGSHFDLIVGRQAIAWGTARAVNPTDILAPFAFNDLDTEDRPGVDAARIRVPFGFMGEFDAGYVAGKDFDSDRSVWYLRGKYYLLRTDFSVICMRFGHHLMTGFDLARAIGGAGFWTEIAWVDVGAFDWDNAPHYDDYLRTSIGCDYSFGGDIYTFIEYHFNGVGSNHAEEYSHILTHPAYSDGAVYLMGRHYLAPGVSWQVSPLVTANGEILTNLGDPSLLVAPSLEYNLAENIYLSVGVYIGIGSDSKVTYYPIPELGSLSFKSEFGAYSDICFASLRAYF